MPPRTLGLSCICLVFAAMMTWIMLEAQAGKTFFWSARPPLIPAEVSKVASTAARSTGSGTGACLPPAQPSDARRSADPVPVANPELPPPAAACVPLPDDFLERILAADASAVTVVLPGGGTAKGRVSSIQRDADGLLLIQGKVTHPEAGRFMFQRQTAPGKAGALAGFIHYDQSDVAYQIRPDGEAGKPSLVKTTVEAVVCRAYATAPDAQEIPATHPTNDLIPPDENGVIQLQSLPGAIGVIYLDFDGEVRDFVSWGYINALPSNATNSQIFEVWKGICEDFQPFNLNVTTVRAVYDAAPAGHRIQVVITPTSSAAPGSGGVAYVGSFNWTSDTVCWSFLTSGKNAVEAISHEVGHTLGLSHDGSQATEYYTGHHGWASIMGVGYYQSLTQWSKGEYSNANRTEDDLGIIVSNNNSVDYRPDDHGATFVSATTLEITQPGEVSNEGMIETTEDEDSFRFSTSGGVVALSIGNVPYSPNLDLKAEILNSGGGVIATHDPADSLDAMFSGLSLAAGDYFLRVSGVGKGDLTTGYSDYASLGGYTITGNVAGGVHADHFAVAENPAIGTVLGASVPRSSHGGGALLFAITSGNTGGTFAINPATGSLSVANAALLDFETLSSRWDDPAVFELFVSITDNLGTAMESIRLVVTVGNVNEAPVFPPPLALSVPENLAAGGIITTVVAVDADRSDFVTYSIVDGNTGNAFAIDANSGALTSARTLDFETTPSFTLTVRATDHGSPSLTTDAVLTIHLLDLSESLAPGSVIRTFFNDIAGTTIAALTSSANFPDRPHSEAALTSFDSGTAKRDFYGSTVRGYVIAPATGNYTFWICTDDAGELRISPNANPAGAIVRASLATWANPGEWTRSPTQQSSAVALTVGQAYYIEARHKEGSGGDHVQVAWQGPGMTAKEIIPGMWLAPYQQNYAPWAVSATSGIVRESATAGQRAGLVTFHEPDLGQTIAGYSITGGNEAGIFAINSGGEITVANSSRLVAGTTHCLTISATDSGTPAMVGTTTLNLQVLGLNEQVHAWWKLDESAGTTVSDSSGNARHATLSGGGSWVARGPANQALQLDGATTRFDYLGNNSLSGDTSFSVSAWVKVPVSHSSDGVLIQQREAGASGHIGRYVVKVNADGTINFSVYGRDANGVNEGTQFDITSPTAIKDGLWHHVACVRNGVTGRMFIDGALLASGSGAIRMLDPTLTVAVGCDARDNITFLDAAVDDVRIYADALGSQQFDRIAAMPKVAVSSPVDDSAEIPGFGLVLHALGSVADGSSPAFAWSKLSGPGMIDFGTPAASSTTAVFSAGGTYVLRVTASNGAGSTTGEVSVLAGSTTNSAFAGFTYGSGAAGSHTETDSDSYTLTGASTGINQTGTADGFYLLGQSFCGNFDLRARVTSVADIPGVSSERAGLIIRPGTALTANDVSGFIGSGTGDKGHWVRRTTTGDGNSVSESSSMTLPRWCRLARTGNLVEFWHSSDGVAWISRGTMTFNGEVRAGLCWSSNSASTSDSASFDNVSGFFTSNLGALVSAGADAQVAVAEPFELTGYADDDGMPNPPSNTSIAWSVVSGPGSATFGNSGQAATGVTCAAPGTYLLRLTADDGAVQTFDDIILTAVLINTMGVAATDAAAAETGPDGGTFTFTRGGSLSGDLTVDFTLAGTAANGVDYAALSNSIVIPSGDTTATLTVTPETDELVEGIETAVLSLEPGDYEIIDSTATVAISDSNHAPWWADSLLNWVECAENVAYAGPPIASQATDPDGAVLTFSKTGGPDWLVVATDGSLTGTPSAGDVGSNRFGVRVTDAGGLAADAVVNILVNFLNQAPEFIVVPVIAADAAALAPYTGHSLAASATDPNLTQGDVLAFSKLDGPAWLAIAQDGSLSGTAPVASLGTNLFIVRVSDAAGATADMVLQISVTPPRLFLDANGAAAGLGAPVSMVWDASAIWSAEATGATDTLPWIGGAHAVLSAGSDATDMLVTVAGTQSLGSLTVEEGRPTLAGGTLDLSGAATRFAITGTAEVNCALSGSGMGLFKSGPGTLVLSGNNSYTGGTTVSAGTLCLTSSLPAGGGVIVATNGTLSGAGSVPSGIAVSGTLAPGHGIGTLTTGPVAATTGARLEWQAGDWAGVAGSGYDTIIAASLDLTDATAVTVVLKAESLANFSESPAVFTLVQTAAGISGFEAGKFTIDAAAFPGPTGTWDVRRSGNALELGYTPPTPFEVWQRTKFGMEAGNPLLAGEMADPDDDGRPNLLEYALGSEPNEAGPANLVFDWQDVAGSACLRLTIDRNAEAADVTFTVQTTGDPSDPVTWTDADTFIEENTPARLVVRDTGTGLRRFIRLRVTR